jgi:hypothetical protein
LAAIEGAINASEMPTASQRRKSRRRCWPSAPVFLASVVMVAPLLDRGDNPRPTRMPTISHAASLWSIAPDPPLLDGAGGDTEREVALPAPRVRQAGDRLLRPPAYVCGFFQPPFCEGLMLRLKRKTFFGS